MKLALLFPAAALVLAPSVHASLIKNHALAQPTQTAVPPVTASGLGSGVLTTPGLYDGNVMAQLYDQAGTPTFVLQGSVVYMVPASDGRESMQGQFHGALISPGVRLDVEGTWMISAQGQGMLAAVVFGPAEEGGPGQKIGMIKGAFALPGVESLASLGGYSAADLESRERGQSRERAQRRERRQVRDRLQAHGPVLIVDPLGDYIDPNLNGITVPLKLRWKIAG